VAAGVDIGGMAGEDYIPSKYTLAVLTMGFE
jgi:hypothetical protein